MNFFGVLRRSVVVRHVLLFCLVLALIMRVGVRYLYRAGEKALFNAAQREAQLISNANVNRYDQLFSTYHGISKTIATMLGERPAEQWDSLLEVGMKNLAVSHPEICAVGASALSGEKTHTPGKLTMALHRKGLFEVKHGTAPLAQEWFVNVAKAGTGIWNEPFLGNIIPEWLVVYSFPVYRTVSGGGKKMAGVACLALAVQELDREISSIHIENQGFMVMVSPQGRVLSARNKNNIGRKASELLRGEVPFVMTPEVTQKFDEAFKNKCSTHISITSPEDGKRYYAFCQPMKTTGWLFGVAFPEEAIYAPVKGFQSSMVVLIGGITLAMILFAILLTCRISIPLHRISCFAEEIGKGNFSEPAPEIKGRDEIADMSRTIDKMRTSLVDYIQSVQKVSELEEERAKNRKLLLNTLPEHVVDEFIRTGKCAPEYSESATVFFSDVVGFTTLSSKLPAAVVIDELNSIFTNFDRIFRAHGVERIKTIGDAYMAIAGLHPPKENHCERVLDAALEIRRFLRERNAGQNMQWRIRVGIHTGNVAAGIVGTERYVYDVFGDAVNTAARMEQLSEPMQINVSETVQLIAKKHHFTKRPLMEVKGKGALQMYFLEDEEENKI